MGAKYTTQTVSGFDASPPSDDGTVSAANQVKWSTIKSKLASPLNTWASAVDTALVAAFNTSVNQKTANYTTVAGDHLRTVEVAPSVSSAVTISLGDATAMTSVYQVTVKNSGTSTVTVGRITSGDTIDGVAGNLTLAAGQSITLCTNAAANGYVVVRSANYSPGNHSIAGTLAVTGATTLSAALTYGGVALTNAVTGTGKMVLDTAPTFASTITVTGAATLSSTLAAGATTITGTLTTTGLVGFGVAAGTYAVRVLTSGNNGIFLDNGTNQLYMGSTGGAAAYGTLSAHSHVEIVNGIVVGTWASTGLAVTGTTTTSGALIMSTTETPTGAGTGVAGQFAWDTNYLYICTATNDWRRIALVDF